MHCTTFVAALGFLTLLGVPACIGTAESADPKVHRMFQLSVGERRLDSGDFPGVERSGTMGLEFDSYRPDAWFGYEIAAFYSDSSDDLAPAGNYDVRVAEFSVGLRKTFDRAGGLNLYPYVGVGVALFHTEVDLRAPGLGHEEETDTDTGVYGHVGFYSELWCGLTIGVDVRFVSEETFDYGGFDLDHEQYSVRLGCKF